MTRRVDNGMHTERRREHDLVGHFSTVVCTQDLGNAERMHEAKPHEAIEERFAFCDRKCEKAHARHGTRAGAHERTRDLCYMFLASWTMNAVTELRWYLSLFIPLAHENVKVLTHGLGATSVFRRGGLGGGGGGEGWASCPHLQFISYGSMVVHGLMHAWLFIFVSFLFPPLLKILLPFLSPSSLTSFSSCVMSLLFLFPDVLFSSLFIYSCLRFMTFFPGVCHPSCSSKCIYVLCFSFFAGFVLPGLMPSNVLHIRTKELYL